METVLRVLGLLVVLGGGAFSLLAAPLLGSNSLLLTLGFAIAFCFIGFSIYRFANNGFRAELRIDTRFGELKLGTVNANDDFTQRRVFRKSEIESVFLQRAGNGRAKLCMRLKKGGQKIEVFDGTEDELTSALERIVQALFGIKGKKQRVQTRVNGDLIQATLT